ncbi:MAG: pyruvate, phosphate dikinase [Deltaproteobacteria bacterium]|nr:pyruvate, phosphate dikinase [Deltaproteobacteria bacterium]
MLPCNLRVWTCAIAIALSACGKASEPPGSGSSGSAGSATAVLDAAPPVDPGEPDGGAPVVRVPDTEPARRMWIPQLASEADFLAYSKELGGERFTKFVVDLRTDAVYYFDVDVYRVHKDFVFAELYKKARTREAVKIFDANYTAKKPEFLLCYLVHHLGPDVWTMAFWEGDLMTKEHVEHAYKRMRETFYLADKVKYRPDSTRQENMAKTLVGVPVVTNDALYKDAPYQAFNPGTAIGTLRVVPAGADVDSLQFGEDEIVILPDVLPDITPVAGILSETFSTPLSHVSLRARAWGIPNVGLKDARKRFADLAGKVVRFEATPSSADVRLATPDEIAAWKAKATATREVLVPVANLAATDLLPLDQLRAKDVTAYGTKAANLGEIVHGLATGAVKGFTVPAGFGVPIADYDAHMKKHGLDKQVTALLADPRFAKDAAYRKAKLDALRAAIIAAPMDEGLAQEIVGSVEAITGGDATKGVFVRSSTNAEDLPGFNGAGLYDTVPNVVGPEAIEKAVKTVWASVWNLRAYEERQHFNIDHSKVYGGVLIQVGIDATAAGVLVTAHPTDPLEKTTYAINAKSGLGLRVVEGKKVPESLLYDFHNNGLRVLSRSDEDTMLVFDGKGGVREVPNPQKGQPILTNARARHLGAAARAVVGLFPKDRPLDIEWLFQGEELFIVQARPYVVH